MGRDACKDRVAVINFADNQRADCKVISKVWRIRQRRTLRILPYSPTKWWWGRCRYGRDWCTVIAVLPIGAYMLKYNIHYFHFRLYMHLCQISQALLKFTDIFTALHFALNVVCFLSLSFTYCNPASIIKAPEKYQTNDVNINYIILPYL